MTNKLDQVYNKLRGRKLCGLEAQCFDGVMIEEVIRHRLGVPEHEHPYFDDVDMVGIAPAWTAQKTVRFLVSRGTCHLCKFGRHVTASSSSSRCCLL